MHPYTLNLIACFKAASAGERTISTKALPYPDLWREAAKLIDALPVPDEDGVINLLFNVEFTTLILK